MSTDNGQKSHRNKMAGRALTAASISKVLCNTFYKLQLIILTVLIVISVYLLISPYFPKYENVEDDFLLVSDYKIKKPSPSVSTTREPLVIDNVEDLDITLKQNPQKMKIRRNKYRIATGNSKSGKPVDYSEDEAPQSKDFTCPAIRPSKSDFDSVDIYAKLKFEEMNEWNYKLNQRFKSTNFESPSLKVIVVPQAFNDPKGALTLDEYYQMWTKYILDLVVKKLHKHKQMTFVWNEVVFLSMWWKTASEVYKDLFKDLVREGRLEVTTGGWVSPDETVLHMDSMISQLIEGQEWLKTHIGILPESAWSVDTAGHGSVMPYLLKSAQIDSVVTMKIHYAWKSWLADNQYGDFKWGQRWDDNEENSILCHQRQLYKIKPTNETTKKMTTKKVAQKFLAELGHAASLTKHNVVMVVLGDDSRFRNGSAWDLTYDTFVQLLEEINTNPGHYKKAWVEFGTVKTYFKAVRQRQKEGGFPVFNGDFFTYSDDIDEKGHSAYWSGLYGARPYWKQLHREAEMNLRSAEMLLSFSKMKSADEDSHFSKCFTNDVETTLFKRLQIARRQLAQSAHHATAPGVASARVMKNIGYKLNEVKIRSMKIQTICMGCLIRTKSAPNVASASLVVPSVVITDFSQSAQKTPLNFTQDIPTQREQRQGEIDENEVVDLEKHILVVNNLAWAKLRIINVLVTSSRVQVFGPNDELIPSQLNPLITREKDGISDSFFELVFYYRLEALSITKFKIVARGGIGSYDFATRPKVSYRNLADNGTFGLFKMHKLSTHEDGEDLSITNDHYKLNFNGTAGLLQSAQLLKTKQEIKLPLKFGAYAPIDERSGAHVLVCEKELNDPGTTISQNPFEIEDDTDRKILMIDGPIETSLQVITPAYHHVVKLLKPPSSSPFAPELEAEILMGNMLDIGGTDGEYYMRFDTDINNNYGGPEKQDPVMFTDQSGFTFEKRVTVPRIGVEGNYYPITTMGYIQDGADGGPSREGKRVRMSMLVGRAHGISSFQKGRLELMIDRRVLYNDERGAQEGILDNRPTMSNYILKLEPIDDDSNDYQATLPTLAAHQASQRLNNHVQVFYYDTYEEGNGRDDVIDYFRQISLVKELEPIPSDTHLITLRIQPSTDSIEAPSRNVLMILQKLGYSCSDKSIGGTRPGNFFQESGTLFLSTTADVRAKKMDLAGLRELSSESEAANKFQAKPFQISSYLLHLQ